MQQANNQPPPPSLCFSLPQQYFSVETRQQILHRNNPKFMFYRTFLNRKYFSLIRT